MDMFLTCLDEDFREIYILEQYKSLLWTERYWDSGDFDLTCPPEQELLNVIDQIQYLDLGGVTKPEKQIMEIKTRRFITDPKNGDEIILKGYTLDRKLNSRIIWNETLLYGEFGSLDMAILLLVSDATHPHEIRGIPRIEYVPGEISSIPLLSYFYGEPVDEVIRKLCKTKEIGLYAVYNEQYDKIHLHLREGVDRSKAQTQNRVVSFTTDLNNLLNATWTKSTIPYKNVCLVIGENGQIVVVGDAVGEERRELFYRPSIVQGELMNWEYEALLVQKGLEELTNWQVLETFDGEIDPDSYVFGTDYNMGDILSLADDYGHEGRGRIIEMIYFQDPSGFKVYPTFETVVTSPGGPGG